MTTTAAPTPITVVSSVPMVSKVFLIALYFLLLTGGLEVRLVVVLLLLESVSFFCLIHRRCLLTT